MKDLIFCLAQEVPEKETFGSRQGGPESSCFSAEGWITSKADPEGQLLFQNLIE